MTKEIRPDSRDFEDWPASGLEYLGQCPVCGVGDRRKLYENLRDRMYSAPGKWTLYSCDGCGSGYLDPRPDLQTISLAYKHYATHEFQSNRDLAKLGCVKRLQIAIRNGYLNRKYNYHLEPSVPYGYLAMHLLPPPVRLEWDHYARSLPRPQAGHNRLLDVGCGNGEFLARAREAGWQVQGLDFDPAAADLVRSMGIDIWVGGYQNAPFEAGHFDVITTHQVIEHVHAPSMFVKQLVTWLKPDGRLWVGTPNFSSWSHSLFQTEWKLLHPPQHLVLLSPKALSKIFHENGLTVHFCPRGFFESHVLAESRAIQEGAVGLKEIIRKKNLSKNRFLAMLLELGSWWLPKYGSDMVVWGVKQS